MTAPRSSRRSFQGYRSRTRGTLLALFTLAPLLFVRGVQAQAITVPARLYARPGAVVALDLWADAGIVNLVGVDLTLNINADGAHNVPAPQAALNAEGDPYALPGRLIPRPFTQVFASPDTFSALLTTPATAGGSGPGWIVSLPLQVPATAPAGAVYPLTFSRLNVTLGDAAPLALTAESAIVVDPDTPRDGDLNADGRITVQDATLALRIAAQLLTPTPTQHFTGDLSPRDGRVNVGDAIGILRLAAGL